MKRAGWIPFVVRRWFDVRTGLSGSGASRLASVGIATGVATLVVVLGVMNGFQSGYMNAILEVLSFHARVTLPDGGSTEGYIEEQGLVSRLAGIEGVQSVLRFREARVLAASKSGRVAPIKVLVLPKDFAERDPGFAAELGVSDAAIDGGRGVCLGSEIARQLGVRKGDFLSLYLPASSPEEGLSVREESLRVSGIFASGYYQFDSGLALLAEATAGSSPEIIAGSRVVYGVKLKNLFADRDFISRFEATTRVIGALESSPSGLRAESWRDYNRAFFGALRTEKTLMFILVGLVFIVVGVNIHHSMRRIVAMRSEDIGVLRSLGASVEELRSIFAVNGMLTGLRGAFFGLLFGFFIAVNINGLAGAATELGRLAADLARVVVPSLPPSLPASAVFYMDKVPVRLYLPESMAIGLVAIASSILAALSASNGIARLRPSEILRYE